MLAFLIPFSLAAPPAAASSNAAAGLPAAGLNLSLLNLICVGTSSISISPGLTNTPQLVTITSTNIFPSCTSLTDPTIRSASFTAVVHTTRSCTDLLNSGSGSRTITYNTGNTTTYTSTFAANYAGGQLTVVDVGTVTGGQFLHSAFTSQAIYAADLSACNTDEGLTSMIGPFTIEIGP